MEPQIVLQYALMLVKHQFYNKSLDILSSYLHLHPQDQLVKKSFDIANALNGVNSFQRNCKDPVHLYNQGVFYFHQGRIHEALKIFYTIGMVDHMDDKFQFMSLVCEALIHEDLQVFIFPKEYKEAKNCLKQCRIRFHKHFRVFQKELQQKEFDIEKMIQLQLQ